MGEAKRRGTKEQRVQAGIAKRMDAAEQAKLQLELLQRRRDTLMQTMPPMDKLAIQQRQMLAEATHRMKMQAEGGNIHRTVDGVELQSGVPISIDLAPGTDMNGIYEVKLDNEDVPILTDAIVSEEETAFFEPIEHVTES